jgi:sugar O-acyltransferase (sialic acid O-acetyltransferase NeuD family)
VRIHLIGAGGFAREVLDLIEALIAHGDNLSLAGIYADGHADTALLAARGYEFTGPVDSLPPPTSDDRFVIGFGQPAGREKVDHVLLAEGWQTLALVHPLASLGSAVSLGPGSIVCVGARVSTNVMLGRHVQVNPNATVGHDAVLDDYVSVNPLASVGGNSHVHRRSLVGTGANIIERITIGPDVVVGAGAVVIEDVLGGTTVVGVPARSPKAGHG